MTKIEHVLHDAHLRYQRESLNGSLPETVDASMRRGLHREKSLHERSRVWCDHWLSSTKLRPNFYRAYFETLIYMVK